MSHKATIWFAAACLILIVQVSSAWKPELCNGTEGELISLEVDTCPDMSAKYCEIPKGDPVGYHIKFRTGKLFYGMLRYAIIKRFYNNKRMALRCERKKDKRADHKSPSMKQILNKF